MELLLPWPNATEEKDANHIRNIAKLQTQAGANIIDVCASVDDKIEM